MRISWLPDGPLPPHFTEAGRIVRVGSMHARTLAPQPTRVTFAELSRSEPCTSSRLRFLTPTYFSRHDRTFPLPDPRLVFAGLIDRWNAFAAGVLVDEELRKTFLNYLEVTDFDIAHGRLLVDRQPNKPEKWQQGFTGVVEFSLARGHTAPMPSILAAMSAFAGFSGVGAATTQGFGACLPEGV